MLCYETVIGRASRIRVVLLQEMHDRALRIRQYLKFSFRRNHERVLCAIAIKSEQSKNENIKCKTVVSYACSCCELETQEICYIFSCNVLQLHPTHNLS